MCKYSTVTHNPILNSWKATPAQQRINRGLFCEAIQCFSASPCQMVAASVKAHWPTDQDRQAKWERMIGHVGPQQPTQWWQHTVTTKHNGLRFHWASGCSKHWLKGDNLLPSLPGQLHCQLSAPCYLVATVGLPSGVTHQHSFNYSFAFIFAFWFSLSPNFTRRRQKTSKKTTTA